MKDLLFYALFTIMLEIPIVFVLLKNQRSLSLLLIIILINIITNLPLNGVLVSGIVSKSSYNLFILISEILIILLEGMLYRYVLSISRLKAYTTSLAANLFSFIVGVILLW